ncbi:17299_t:CDS:2, partial [Racocetra fulgida]
PTFTAYPDKTNKKFTQYSSLSTSQNIYSSDFLSASSSNTTLPIVECISSDEELSDSNVKLLLTYLSENFDSYRKNKEKFYASAALHLGGKSSVQVRDKLQRLVKKYSEE